MKSPCKSFFGYIYILQHDVNMLFLFYPNIYYRTKVFGYIYILQHDVNMLFLFYPNIYYTAKFFKGLIFCIIFFGIGLNTAFSDELNEKNSHFSIYAVESELAFSGDMVYNMYVRPFVYDGSSYIPLRNAVESLGGAVSYDGNTNSVSCQYQGKNFEIGMIDSRIRVYDNTSFIKIRDLCNALGIDIAWYDGIIVISDNNMTLSEQEVAEYKDRLWYNGYEDKYLSEIHSVVYPYEVYSYDTMIEDIRELQKMYPQLISVYSIGKSAEGRDMTAFWKCQ